MAELWFPGVVGLTTIRLWSNSLSTAVDGRTSAALNRAYKELQLFTRVNNDWMRALYVPITNLGFVALFCWALFSTAVFYGDENVHLYVYALSPIMVIYGAFEIPGYLTPIAVLTKTTGEVSLKIYGGNGAEALTSIADILQHGRNRHVRHHTVTISKPSNRHRHRLISLRPIVIDMGPVVVLLPWERLFESWKRVSIMLCFSLCFIAKVN